MYWTFGEYIFKSETSHSKSELNEVLRQCGGGSILLGQGAEAPREFYVLTATRTENELEEFCIGIYSEGHGLVPHILLRPDSALVWIGFNSEAAAIDLGARKIAFSLSLDSLFRRFVPLLDNRDILLFHEIGLMRVSEKGEERWRYSKDIITKCRIKGSEIALEFMDSNPVVLEISTGRLKAR